MNKLGCSGGWLLEARITVVVMSMSLVVVGEVEIKVKATPPPLPSPKIHLDHGTYKAYMAAIPFSQVLH